MTWVIGSSTLFGYSFLISDIYVKWNEDTSKDCLLKIYPVGRYLAAGFSGSVKLGFEIINDLKKFLYIPPQKPEGAWVPEIVTLKWWRRARKIFDNAPNELKELGCSIIVAGVHPTKNAGDAPWPINMSAVFKSPNFEPEYGKPNELLSIGCGSSYERFKKKLKELSDVFKNPLIKLECNSPGGYANAILINTTDLIEKNPLKGISKYLHMSIVKKGEIAFYNNNHQKFTKDGKKIDFKIPDFVRSWDELCKISKELKVSAISAIT